MVLPLVRAPVYHDTPAAGTAGTRTGYRRGGDAGVRTQAARALGTLARFLAVPPLRGGPQALAE